jgi:hypothetical protein
VEPDCPFVRRYPTKHPEFNSLVALDWSGDRSYTQAEERRIREAALDDTIAESLPASDPASTDPNPFKKS